MAKRKTNERRNFERAKRVLAVQFRVIKSRRKNYDDTWALSTTHDMSVGGVGFYTDRELSVNDILEMEIIMSGVIEVFRGTAKVVRVEKQKNKAHYFVGVKVKEDNTKKKRRSAKSYTKTRRK